MNPIFTKYNSLIRARDERIARLERKLQLPNAPRWINGFDSDKYLRRIETQAGEPHVDFMRHSEL